jgi:hypothetical protein
MKVLRSAPNRMALEEFAEKHDLVLEIHERTRTELHPDFELESNRFYVCFKGVETKDGPILSSAHGNGATEGMAMQEYAAKISGKLLVVDSFTKKRREFYAPELFVAL